MCKIRKRQIGQGLHMLLLNPNFSQPHRQANFPVERKQPLHHRLPVPTG